MRTRGARDVSRRMHTRGMRDANGRRISMCQNAAIRRLCFGTPCHVSVSSTFANVSVSIHLLLLSPFSPSFPILNQSTSQPRFHLSISTSTPTFFSIFIVYPTGFFPPFGSRALIRHAISLTITTTSQTPHRSRPSRSPSSFPRLSKTTRTKEKTHLDPSIILHSRDRVRVRGLRVREQQMAVRIIRTRSIHATRSFRSHRPLRSHRSHVRMGHRSLGIMFCHMRGRNANAHRHVSRHGHGNGSERVRVRSIRETPYRTRMSHPRMRRRSRLQIRKLE